MKTFYIIVTTAVFSAFSWSQPPCPQSQAWKKATMVVDTVYNGTSQHIADAVYGVAKLQEWKLNGPQDNGDFNIVTENFKVYQIPKAQLIIADVPYNLGNYAYASNPAWYKDGDNKKGESELAGTEFFDTDKDFKPSEFMHFCSTMLVKEPKGKKEAPCMVLFCEFEQQFHYIELAKKYGLPNYINLVFRKNFSAQVLKANMKIVGNCEYGLVLYRDKLPKFRNDGKMIFNCIDWPRERENEKIHPTQKPVKLLEKIIEIYTDEGDVIIDPVAGSGSSLVAAENLNREAYGFEIKRDFHKRASDWIEKNRLIRKEIKETGFANSEISKFNPTFF